jgi:hypothetical protein
MTRRAIATFTEDDGQSFTEHYLEGERGSFTTKTDDAETWYRGLLDYWNSTLRPGDKRRTFVSCVFESADVVAKVAHDWQKTNLTTIARQGRYYDTARCSQCGITGKRFGVSDVTRDPAFKANGYATCNGASVLLERLRAKRQKTIGYISRHD